MKDRTTEKDICTELINCVNKKLAYSFANLVAICTDGAPAMCGKHTGTVSLIQEVIERRIITHPCIFQQQTLCGKIYFKISPRNVCGSFGCKLPSCFRSKT